jgi:predicted transglutaminase-like cysteine proteinase
MIMKPGHRKYLLVSLIIMLTALPVAYTYEKEFLENVIENVAKTYGERAVKRFKKWVKLIEKNTEQKELRKLAKVNDFINRSEWESDIDNYGQEDYWATPLELLGRNRGDCEDFSIAKYFTLTMMGVPVDKLRITYVTALDYQRAHIVLAYYETPGSDPLILDSLESVIFRASRRPDLKPVYSFNTEFIWKSKSRGKDLKVGMSRMLGRFEQWSELLSKMKKEIGHSE